MDEKDNQNLEQCSTNCDCLAINEDKVARLKSEMAHEEEIMEVADLFKLFADSTRTKILLALAEDELCVCDLSALLNMSKSLISHQLRKLREAKLVKFRKDGKMAYYSLDDEHVRVLLKVAREHLSEREFEEEKIDDKENGIGQESEVNNG